MDLPNFDSSSVRSIRPPLLPPCSMPTTDVFDAEYAEMKQTAQTTDVVPDTLTSSIGSLRTPPEVCQPLPPAVCSAPSALPEQIDKGAAATGVQRMYQSLLPAWTSHGGQSHLTYQRFLQPQKIRSIGGNPRNNPLYDHNQIPSRVPSIRSHGSNVYESVSNGSMISSHYHGHPEDYLVPLMNQARMRMNPLYSQPDLKKSCLAQQSKCLLRFALVIISVIACFSLAFATLTQVQIFNLKREVLAGAAGLVNEHQTLPTGGQVLKGEKNNILHKLNCDFAESSNVTVGLFKASTDWVPQNPGPNMLVIFASCNAKHWNSNFLEQQNYSQADGLYKQYRCTCSGYFSKVKNSSCEISYWRCSGLSQTL